MKKVFLSILIGGFSGIQTVFASGSIEDVQITRVFAGGYIDGNRATTRISISPPVPEAVQDCLVQSPIVIYSGVVRAPSVTVSDAVYVASTIQTEYYQQQYATALAAVVNGSSIDAFIINGCTSDGQFPRANRITVK